MSRLGLIAAALLLASCGSAPPPDSGTGTRVVDTTGSGAGDIRLVRTARDLERRNATFQGLAVVVSFSPSNAAVTTVRPRDPEETLPTVLATDLNYADLIRQTTRCRIVEGGSPRVEFNENFEPVLVTAVTDC